MKKLFIFRSLLPVILFHFALTPSSYALELVGDERNTIREIDNDELTPGDQEILSSFFNGKNEITRAEIQNAAETLYTTEINRDWFRIQELFEQLISKLDPEYQSTVLSRSSELRAPLWSIINPVIPAPQPPQVRGWFKSGMSLLDRTFDYFPRKIQELVWYYISNTASECPKNKILGGDFSTLCEKGLLRFILDMIPQHTSDSESKDPWLSFRVGPISMIVPLDPEMALEILRSNNVHRGMAYDRLVDFFGKGIFTSRDYPRWEYQREIAKQLFHTESLKKMTSELYPLLLEEVRKASQTAHGQPTDLVLLLSRVGLLAFCDSVLGIDVRDQADSLAPAVNHVLAYINGALEPVHLPFDSSYQEFKRNRDIVYDWMQMAIERVRIADREGRAPHNPLVDAIVSLTDEDRQDEVVEFTLSMVLGGHETTARLMLGALYSLMQHPHYIDQIRDEVDTYLPDDSSIPSHQDLRTKLPRLHTVIQESLRLYPPVWLLARTPKEDLSIQGHTILAGTEILISPLILHRLSSVWGSDSERFRPERFDEKIPDLYKKFLPFVAGPERCPGRDFAELESKLLIAGLLKHFDIKLSDPQQHPEPTSAGTFRLFQTLDVIIQDR